MVEPVTWYRKTKAVPKDRGRYVKITQELPQREVQIWNNLSFEKKSNGNNYNTLNKQRFHEFTVDLKNKAQRERKVIFIENC